MKPVTAGERLYLLIRDEVLDLTGEGAVKWINAAVLLDDLSGNPNFTAYIKGAAAVHAMRRILRYWEEERLNVPAEAHHVRMVASFIKRNVFPVVSDELCRKMARAAIASERSSHQRISLSTRAVLLRQNRRHSCYLCGDTVDSEAAVGAPEYLTLEHLWPTSMGGDSVEANLLPACAKCQRITKDTLSWEWLNIHNFVLPSRPSPKALESVDRRARYARHYLHVLQSIESESLTLKEGFLRIGPAKAQITHVRTSLPITFFDLQTAVEP